MSTLGKAVIEFAADTATFTGDIGRTAAMFDKSMHRMEQGIANLKNAVVTAAGLGGLGMLVKRAIDTGEELHNLAQKSGVSVQALSELRVGASLAGLDLGSLNTGLKDFNKSIVEASDRNSTAGQLFQALGVDITQGPEKALKLVAQRIAEMPDGAQKAKLAIELFGKAGADMIPWLNQGAEGMERTAAQARALGLAMGPEFAARAEAVNGQLKLLGMMGERVGLSIAERLVPGMNAFTAELVKAAEKGELLLGLFREMNKMIAATFGSMPRWTPFNLGGWAERAADELFKPPSTGGASGSWGDKPKPAGGNPEQLACILSGGKWQGGKCVRQADTAAAEKEMQRYLRIAQLIAQDQEERQRVQGEINDDATRRHLARIALIAQGEAELQNSINLNIIEQFELRQANDEAQLRAIQRERDEHQKLLADIDRWKEAQLGGAKQMEGAAHQLGLSFSSAFEDAILRANALRDIVRGLAQDVLRIMTRKLLTESMANMATAAINGGIRAMFGGGQPMGDTFQESLDWRPVPVTPRAMGGPVTGGMPYWVGERGPELVVPGADSTVIPNHGLGGPQIFIDARGADRQGIAELRAMFQSMNASFEERAWSAVANFRGRGRSMT